MSPPDIGTLLQKRRRPGETVIQVFLAFCAGFSILITTGIVFTLGWDALRFFTNDGADLWSFFTGTVWEPQIERFGILPLLNSTLMTSLIAMLVAGPVGMAIGIYLAEYASRRTVSWLKPVLEILSGIPTVVYGYFAVTAVTPWLQATLGVNIVEFYNVFSAGLVMGILITPLVASMSEDALAAVPRSLRQAGYAMGATKLEVSLQVTLPAAASGIVAALVLGLSRAVGETMIVALAAGAGSKLTANPFEGAETMTGHIVRISGGDISYQSVDYDSLFAIALLLFFITLALNFFSRKIIEHFREVYE